MIGRKKTSKIRSIKMKILIMSTFNCNNNGLSMCYGAAQRCPIAVIDL